VQAWPSTELNSSELTKLYQPDIHKHNNIIQLNLKRGDSQGSPDGAHQHVENDKNVGSKSNWALSNF